MQENKLNVLGVNIVVSAFIVYVSAILVRVVSGQFLFAKGIFDVGYLVLTLGIAVPIIFYSLMATKNVLEVTVLSSVFIFVLFFSVYFTLTVENPATTLTDLMNFIIVIVGMAIAFITTIHFAVNDKQGSSSNYETSYSRDV
ncbi:hypothetical protein [Sutcliffiella halmapala]|uniref:hypothetical protein n=1 Tax=Sutcliffiella halmapala TaxID=79882 RepID=UPI00099566A3|nr:hypothetical protein [Sutcliffiella halmapala]